MKDKNNNKSGFSSLGLSFGLTVLLNASAVFAGPFEIGIAPSRFEVSGNSGQRVGQSIDIHNVGAAATDVSLRTLDWDYAADGKITYYDELRPGSCREWVTLERNAVSIPANSKKTFRFQIDVPANAPRSECRFMLAVEGVEPAYRPLLKSGGASMSLPVSGRIAVAVYMAVNGAEPSLALQQLSVQNVNGQRTPMVSVTNQGDAHGRLDGALSAVDAKGLAFELVPDGTPVMPGQTRLLALTPTSEASRATPSIAFPVTSSGTIDWEKGSFRVNAQFK